MLLNEEEISIPKLTQIIYDLYKTGIDDKESLKESSPDISGAAEELLEESIAPVANSDLI